MKISLSRYESLLFIAALLLLGPALLINLGLLPFIDDEAIRSLVALEMKLSGNYITPTLNGAYYYNKPPLYNWLLLVSFNAFGSFSEWSARVPTIVFLLAYAATIFYFFRKHYDRFTAFLNAFALITCGRILFWDSMLGLIDICFSWLMFLMFMVVYHQFKAGRWYRLFLGAYTLAALGFLMKGLPSVVFLGLTLLAYFIYKKQFKRLFSLPHIAGGLLGLAIVGAYYLAYHQYNSLENVFTTLFSESSKRTVARFGIGQTIQHVFSFPFEMVYHFLPWSALVIYFIKKGIVKEILQDEFMTFNLLTFLVNIVLYWTSPEVYPRYLLMLTPLLFGVLFYLHQNRREQKHWTYWVIDKFFFLLCLSSAIAWLWPLWMERTQDVPLLYAKIAVLVGSMSALTVLYLLLPERRMLVMVIFLLIFRVGFNWFVLPDRNEEDFGSVCRQTSKDVGRNFSDRPLMVWGETEMQMTNSFYITNERGAIVPIVSDTSAIVPEAFYIIDTIKYKHINYDKIAEIRLRHGKLTYVVGPIRPQ